MERFTRIRCFLGEDRFRVLQEKSVTIVGIGAVGGHVVEGLVRSGLKNLRVVDFDTIQPSNINRQLLALESTLGQAKVQAAFNRARDINPACRVEPLQLFADQDSRAQILDPAPDLLIDCIDSLNPKCQLLYGAWQRKIPTLSSMGAALRTDPRQIKLADIMETKNCPLARRVRKRLRQQGYDGGITCVYSTETVTFHYQEPETDEPAGNSYAERGRRRRTLGSLPTLTGIFGLILANEAIARLAPAT